ncbi:MAG: response regulator [Acidobacteriia bacterium]|nr:response regulator [Terriglobia bacterium]
MANALVVDDSRAVRMILSRNLREVGYDVREAGNGREALAVVAAEKASLRLVLTDWNMPEMNGLELLKCLRSDPELASLVVIMITTETEMEHMTEALDAGANEYVMKPFDKEILFQKLGLAGLRV